MNPEIGLMAIINLKRRGEGLCPIYHCIKYVEEVYNSFLPTFHVKDLCPVLIGAVESIVSVKIIGRPQRVTVQPLAQGRDVYCVLKVYFLLVIL